MFTNKEIQEVTEHLKKPEVEKVILFGSYAVGKQSQYSDLDLMVITKDTFIPDSFSQKSAIYIKINNYITEYRKKYPIDLVVFTHGMYEKFVSLKSIFSIEILENGKVLYEADKS